MSVCDVVVATTGAGAPAPPGGPAGATATEDGDAPTLDAALTDSTGVGVLGGGTGCVMLGGVVGAGTAGVAAGMGVVSGTVAAGGGTVGAGVGGGVTGGGGGGVGTGVGTGVAGPITVTLPVMNEWIAQWYVKVPARAMTIVFEPLLNAPVSHAPPSALEVCATLSKFVQVTESPRLTVTEAGWNEKLRIATGALAASAAPPRASSPTTARSTSADRLK